MTPGLRQRLARVDWDEPAQALDERGYAKLVRLLTAGIIFHDTR